ncbi:P1 family peptidase [Corynebacterium alimapuense]|uniref:Peptidase n=1 Tax=Corynebacterium alimapuense TaxID=1576874 RepID=A0A3M8KB59_9CORY|nr:P1 family peptidase [Corynebacterium alimapuense]RNE49698.1 peptidase [Corynebacterium alimapuense]
MSSVVSGSLIDVPGLSVGHASLGDTGVSVILGSPQGMTAGVDVRGGGPGTRETDLLEPYNTVERVHAVLLAGGSAFGLAAADGVMTQLEAVGIGFPVLGEGVSGPRIPIVPAAVIFDLLVGDPTHRPTAADGAAATRSALEATGSQAHRSGSLGAGCGASAGVLRGGFGQASIRVGDYVVAAAVVANPVGEVVDAETGLLFGDSTLPPVDRAAFARLSRPPASLNTTIGVVATDAPVNKSQAKRLAMVGHDGIARAVRPAHSPLDGDTLFGVSTNESAGGVEIAVLHELSQAAAEVVCAAIVDAVTSAVSGHGLTAWPQLLSGEVSNGPIDSAQS